MAEYVDTVTAETLDDDAMHERFDDWLDQGYEEVIIGTSTFAPSTILRELDPIAYRCGFSEFVDFDLEDGNIVDLSDSPVCEECGEEMTRDEVILSLASHGTLFCESCEEDYEE